VFWGEKPATKSLSYGKTNLTGYVAEMGETRNAHRISVGKPLQKRLFGSPRRTGQHLNVS
jgi:hypothetical protein